MATLKDIFDDNWVIYEPANIKKPSQETKESSTSRWQNLLALQGLLPSKKPEPVKEDDFVITQSIEKPQEPQEEIIQEPYIGQEPLIMSPDGKSAKAYSLAVKDNVTAAYKYLTGPRWSMSPIMASGIIGNLIRENIANPAQTINDAHGTKAFGIACFNSKGKLPDYMGYVAERNLDPNDLYSQLDFIADFIIQGKHAGLTRAMMNPNLTVEQASFAFGKDFEVFAGANGRGYLNPVDPEHIERMRESLRVYKMFNP